MIADIIIDFSKTALGPLSLGVALDRIVDEKDRRTIAWYLFGFHDRPFGTFERTLIVALMSPFITGDKKLNRSAVFSYSLVLSTILIYASFFALTAPTKITLEVAYIYFGALQVMAIVSGLFALLSYPLDLWSMMVTKWLFIDRVPTIPRSLICIALDFALSTAAYSLASGLIIMQLGGLGRFGQEVDSIGDVLSAYALPFLLFSSLKSAAVSALQVTVLSFSLCFRSLLMITRLNSLLALHSSIHEYPFTFIAFLLGLFLYAAKSLF